MEAKLTPINRDEDAPDRELFKRMIESPMFGIFLNRVAGEMKRAEENCLREDSELAVRRAQGSVAAFRTVLALPGRILEDMRSKR